MSVAFPTAIGDQLERASQLSADLGTEVTPMDDRTPHIQQLSTVFSIVLRCSFKLLTSTDRGTLRTFLKTNRAETITWTIDGVDYSGFFDGGYTENKKGNRYNVSFVYRAVEV